MFSSIFKEHSNFPLLKLLCNLLISFFSIVLMFSGIRKERSRNLWFTDFISQFMGPEETRKRSHTFNHQRNRFFIMLNSIIKNFWRKTMTRSVARSSDQMREVSIQRSFIKHAEDPL